MGKRNINFDVWWPDRPLIPRSFWRYLVPHPGTFIMTLLVIGGLLWAQSVGALPLGRPQTAPAAASTGTIAYQGRLADSAGAPLTGTYNMIFRLYDTASAGVPLWEEQWTGPNGVKVSDGLFNVMLGSLTPIPQAVVTGHDQLFLGITVGTDDEMAPRVQLGSVPYATQALTIPDGSVSTDKIADGAVTARKAGLVSRSAGQSSLGSTMSTTYIYFTNRVRVTVDLEVQQCVLVMYSVIAGTSSEGPGDTRALATIFIDSAEAADLAIGSAGTLWTNAPSTIAKVIQLQLPAGSHEIELRFRAGNSGNTATFERATLWVTALTTSCGG